MNRPLSRLLGLQILGVAVGLVLAGAVAWWLLYAGEQFIICLVNHWFGIHLFSDRQEVYDSCILHLNPLNIFP